MTEHFVKGNFSSVLASVMFHHTFVAVVSPLTAEEIAQRREALKQRLAEKKELASQDSVTAISDFSNGNVYLLFMRVFLKLHKTV